MILHVAEIARGLPRRCRINAAFSRQIVVFALTAGLAAPSARIRRQFIGRLKGTILMNGS